MNPGSANRAQSASAVDSEAGWYSLGADKAFGFLRPSSGSDPVEPRRFWVRRWRVSLDPEPGLARLAVQQGKICI